MKRPDLAATPRVPSRFRRPLPILVTLGPLPVLATIALLAVFGGPSFATAQEASTTAPAEEAPPTTWERLDAAIFAGSRQSYESQGRRFDWAPIVGAELSLDLGSGFFVMGHARFRAARRGECSVSFCTANIVEDPAETLLAASLGWRYAGPVALAAHAGPSRSYRAGADRARILAGLFVDVPLARKGLSARIGADMLFRSTGLVSPDVIGGGIVEPESALTLRAGVAYRP